MAYDEETYEKLIKNFELLCNIIKQNIADNKLKVDLSKIEEIINKKIPDTLKKNAPEDFYELYMDFKLEYEKFRDFILYDKLIGKNIIADKNGFALFFMDIYSTGIMERAFIITIIHCLERLRIFIK